MKLQHTRLRMPESPLEWLRAPVTPEDLLTLFHYCNARYFNGAIVPSPGFRLRASKSVKLTGCFHYCLETSTDWGIDISRRLLDHPRALLSTMVHEMIHMLAHQHYRATGNRDYFDEKPLAGKPFVNPGHGAFFLGELERMNQLFSELRITVKSTFGDALYDPSRIAPVRLLLVDIDSEIGKGMIYRLNPSAETDWAQLRDTARLVHGVDAIRILRVRGEHGEGFPALRRDNRARVNMIPRSLRRFADKVEQLVNAEGTEELRDNPRKPSQPSMVEVA